ncbi:alpha/beta fold hydrolase [Mucilaginibacter sp. Bleaf8]|uniref:alpha/beta fold hydrolase n=1 Tax=Mucilaginibacter sp. Bleaf8 TaxID=2834430 RepID=UPI001BCA9AB6|nr:alpha/beta fold hydrolase [Mucilaginibacter sp. Bleaf8]
MINTSLATPVAASSNKPVLVFLQYVGGSAQSWQWLMPLLQNHYHCIAINLPGFGGQPALAQPSIKAFASYVQTQLADLKVDRYTLIGHSMGGKIALQIAVDDQEHGNIERLILLTPSPPSVERMPDAEKQRMLIHPSTKEVAVTVANSTFKKLNDEKYLLAINTQNITDNLVWRWWIEGGMNHSIATQTTSLTIPITVIASENDQAVTIAMTRQDTLPNLPPHAQLITTKDIGHLFPLEDPTWLAGELRKLIA